MASHDESHSHDNSDDPQPARGARAALRDLDGVRARFGCRLATPWWYKVTSALLMALLFVGAGMPYEKLSFGSASTGASLVVLTVVLGPLLLRELLKQGTGASLDRYRNGWTVSSLTVIALLLICVSLQVFADVELAPLVGAGVAFIVTYLYEMRTDQRLARGQFPTSRTRVRR